MEYLILGLKGVAYGITHVVPGLSGGLVLIMLGIYEQFVDTVGNLLIERHRWRQHMAFLVPLGVGMVIGVLALANLMTLILSRYPAPTMFFFMGLLVGTIPSILQLHHDMRPSAIRVTALVLGLLFVMSLRTLGPPEGDGVEAVRQITGPGMIAYNTLISFMAGGASVTPGLDGSYILLLGDTYHPIIDALAALKHLDVRLGALLSTDVGAGLGIILFSKVIAAAIKRAPSIAYYGVLGLVVGSVYGLWPRVTNQDSIPLLVVVFSAGLFLAWYFSKTPEANADSNRDPLPTADHSMPRGDVLP